MAILSSRTKVIAGQRGGRDEPLRSPEYVLTGGHSLGADFERELLVLRQRLGYYPNPP
jgi:hypothetical protein